MNKAVIYNRVAHLGKHGENLVRQMCRNITFAQETGCQIVGVFSEVNSGLSENVPVFEQMIKVIQSNPEIKTLFIEDYTRISRSPSIQAKRNKELSKMKIKIKTCMKRDPWCGLFIGELEKGAKNE